VKSARQNADGWRWAAAAAMLAVLQVMLLSGCDTTAPPLADASASGSDRTVSATALHSPARGGGGSDTGPLTSASGQASGPPVIEMGSGRFIGPVSEQGELSSGISMTGADVTLDFVGVDVRDVARSVLGGLLHVSYVVDPAVKANVTLQTGAPVPRARVLPILTDALQISGVALAERGGVYQLVPIGNATHDAPLGGLSGGGYVTRAVTPQYVAVGELQHVLEPLLPPGSSVQADPSRNLLIVTGTEANVADILRDVSTFDVDYLRGMSFALLPLKNAQAREVAKDVTTLLGSGRGTIGGLVSVSAIDRLNAVLVTSMQPSYIARVRAWVDHLDRSSTGSDQRLYVYRVQNGRASDLAAVLRRALGLAGAPEAEQGNAGSSGGNARQQGDANDNGGSSGAGSASNVLGRAPSVLLDALPGGAAPQSQQTGQGGTAQSQNGLVSGSGFPTSQSAPAAGYGAPSPSAGPSAAEESGLRITSDEVNNALVISATPDEYAHISAALQKLDITPLQVVIDATIAEVTLTNQLQYGLQYYIQSGDFRALLSSPTTTTTTGTTTSTSSATTPGNVISPFQSFNYIPGLNIAITGASGSAVILQALSQLTRVQVLSSPNLLVLNNQSARIQVGDQVPIATQSAVSTVTSGAPTVNSIEYRDTGVILNITPRVNASGLVLLDISEEVSAAGSTTTSTIASPTITQRRIRSSVAVSDGQTIALGGLIQDQRTKGKNGVPFLQDIPVLGWLFGTHNDQLTRTELIALITPHVIRSSDDAAAVTEELRQKLPMTVPALSLRGGG
jgi:general secretion pathway protein D